MNRQFRFGLKQHVGEPDMDLPDDLAELAAALDRKLAADNDDDRPQALQRDSGRN